MGNSVFLWVRDTKYKRILRSYFLCDLLSFCILGMGKLVFSEEDLLTLPTLDYSNLMQISGRCALAQSHGNFFFFAGRESGGGGKGVGYATFRFKIRLGV